MVHVMQIDPVVNGFIVRVGCKTFVMTDLAEMCKHIRGYYQDPNAYAAEFLKNHTVNKDGCETPPLPPPDEEAANGWAKNETPATTIRGRR